MTDALQETAGRIATRIRRQIGSRGRTVPGRVTDTSMALTHGFVWATIGGSTIKLYARVLDDIQVGDWVFCRKMTHDRTSFWIYDSFGQRDNPDGTTTYQPSLSANA